MRVGLPNSTRRILFLLFFVSGFCGLVYQVVWTRLAFAAFGIIMPVLSVVLSVFMLGLSAGAWLGGRAVGWLSRKTGVSAIVLYGVTELLIGAGAFVVPSLFAAGENLLLLTGQTNSTPYLVLSALVLAGSILPWCLLMGATFPLVMHFVRESDDSDLTSFSFLYLANVLGAMCGTFLTAVVFVEVLGFHHTLRVAAAGNFTIAVIAGRLGWGRRPAGGSDRQGRTGPEKVAEERPAPARFSRRLIQWILFSTGFSAMAMEVVWSRQFTPVLKTQVYSFAMIVFTYLGATGLGSWWYRHHVQRSTPWRPQVLLALLAAATFLPGAVCDPRLVEMDPLPDVYLGSAALVLASIIPMCAVLGYLTPDLIDTYSAGHPRLAGRAYAINVLGCILGPLVACYGLLPWMSERWALMILSLPYLLFAVPGLKSLHARWRLIAASGMGALAVYSLFFSQDYEDQMARPSRKTEVRRDYAASVISTDPPSGKTLLVNGIGMTKLTPITKFMVHLPLTAHLGRPQSALIICFGMGTSYRSALSWNLDVTAVELVPSVIKAFGFYHADAPQILNNPRGRLVIDDGRRFLARDRETFDLIVIDPPPPVEAAGSSLLYSTEFYALARQHLKPHGILQAWFPGGERLTTQAVVRSLCDSFPHVRCFFSVEGWGIHMLASMDPIEVPPPEQWAERMPAGARRDLLEWCVRQDLPDYARRVVTNEIPVADILNPNPRVRITDDDPLNEYFLLRQAGLF